MDDQEIDPAIGNESFNSKKLDSVIKKELECDEKVLNNNESLKENGILIDFTENINEEKEMQQNFSYSLPLGDVNIIDLDGPDINLKNQIDEVIEKSKIENIKMNQSIESDQLDNSIKLETHKYEESLNEIIDEIIEIISNEVCENYSESKDNLEQNTSTDRNDSVSQEDSVHSEISNEGTNFIDEPKQEEINMQDSIIEIKDTNDEIQEKPELNETNVSNETEAGITNITSADQAFISKEENTSISDTPIIEVVDFQTEWDILTENEKMLGIIAPIWLSDNDTDVCMKCSARFTFRRRRHHCRACGLIFCSECCNLKLTLAYILTKPSPPITQNNETASNNNNNNINESQANSKLARVCIVCYDTINKGNCEMLKYPKRLKN